MSWIDLKSVRCLATIATGDRVNRVLALNASSDFIATLYVNRAANKPPTDPWPVAPVTATNVTSEAMKSEIAKAIRSAIFLRETDDLNEELQFMDEMKTPVFVALPAAGASNLIKELRSAFETVTFFLLAGDEDSVIEMLRQHNIALLEPLLDKGFERSFLAGYPKLRDRLVERYIRGLQSSVQSGVTVSAPH